MGELISITNEEKRPRVICPHCKREILINLNIWQKDVSQVMKDNCIHCRGEVFAGIMILAQRDLRSFCGTLQVMIDSVQSKNKIIG